MPAYPVAGIDNALLLMRLLEERHSIKLSDVSSELGIGTSTAHRLLSMFRKYGFVEQDEPGRVYRVGSGLLTLSKTLASRQSMLVKLHPVLESLVMQLEETVHVATLRGTDVMYIDCVESRKTERATSRVGRVLPSYATASGKALLSSVSNAELGRMFPTESLPPLTSHTLTTRDALLRDLKRTLHRGFAINENESQLGFFACSSVVEADSTGVLMAVAVAGPSQRFRKNRYRVSDKLCAATDELRGSI